MNKNNCRIQLKYLNEIYRKKIIKGWLLTIDNPESKNWTEISRFINGKELKFFKTLLDIKAEAINQEGINP